jgi:GTPase SAR1 family protein
VRSVAKPEVGLVLIGNKSDLAAQRMVSALEATDFAERHSMSYFEVSAKTGANVPDAVDACIRIIENNLTNERRMSDPGVPLEEKQASNCC